MKKFSAGFSLVEILVVIAIISILATVLLFNFREGSAQSRDVERKAELRNLQTAIELYKQENGRYPAGCKGPGVWSGENTPYTCPSGNQYIVGHESGLRFAPKFISALPTDPKLNGANSGYVYTTNADGTVYKLMARLTVESEVVDYGNTFKSCDATNGNVGICDNNKPIHCLESNATFQTSYAVWGGFADALNDTLVEQYTKDIICDIP